MLSIASAGSDAIAQSTAPKGVPQSVKQQSRAASKTTATMSRLIAEAWSDHDGSSFVPQDSMTYSYSGGRGANPDYDINSDLHEWLYDESVDYEYNSSSYDKIGKSVQTYDGSGNVTEEIGYTWNIGTSSWEKVVRYTYTYTGGVLSKRLTETWNTGTSQWTPNMTNEYTFTNGKLTMSLNKNWNTGTSQWDNSTRNTFTYDGNGNNTGMVYEHWTSGNWEGSYKTDRTFNGSNMKVTETSYNWVMGNWQYSWKDSNGYNGSGQLITNISKMWNTMNSSWENVSRTTYTYSTGNLPTMGVSEDWDDMTSSYENSSRIHFAWNNYDQILNANSDTWNGSSWAPDYGDFNESYYYESYTGVNDVAVAKKSDVIVYPTVTSETLNIYLAPGNTGNVLYRIVDMSGRVQKKWSDMNSGTGKSSTVSVNELPAGNYLLTINENGQLQTKRFTINK